MHYRWEDVPRDNASRLWSAVIAPRPVFLVVSASPEGHENIAAYSSVSLVSIYPPLITISFGQRHGNPKNTLQNILTAREFSINGVPHTLAETANRSAAGTELMDDFARLRLMRRPLEGCSVPGIADSPFSIACELSQVIELDGSSSTLIIGRCKEIYIDDQVFLNELFDPLKADLIGSVGLEEFITLRGEAFALPRTWE